DAQFRPRSIQMLERRTPARARQTIDLGLVHRRARRESRQIHEDVLRSPRESHAYAGDGRSVAPFSARAEQGALYRFSFATPPRWKWQALLRRAHRSARVATLATRSHRGWRHPVR